MRTVSIVIAAYNRCHDLKNVLEDLMALETGGTFVYEVILIDNNSTDATKEIAEQYALQFSQDRMRRKCTGLHYIFEGTQGKSYALNTGLKAVKGILLPLRMMMSVLIRIGC